LTRRCRIGLVVPSSNTTMETELPEMLGRAAAGRQAQFTLHSSRAVLQTVDEEGLREMLSHVERCVTELAHARVDAIANACLVAVMAEGLGAHEQIEANMAAAAAADSYQPVTVTSAGALIRAAKALDIASVAMVTPYAPALTRKVADYIEGCGIRVVDAISRSVTDNVEVGRLDPAELPAWARRLDIGGAEAVVLSACVQMPSLAAIPIVEREFGLPVLSAATATVWDVLRALGLPVDVPDAGELLRTGGGTNGKG
jgi:maleate isomerase